MAEETLSRFSRDIPPERVGDRNAPPRRGVVLARFRSLLGGSLARGVRSVRPVPAPRRGARDAGDRSLGVVLGCGSPCLCGRRRAGFLERAPGRGDQPPTGRATRPGRRDASRVRLRAPRSRACGRRNRAGARLARGPPARQQGERRHVCSAARRGAARERRSGRCVGDRRGGHRALPPRASPRVRNRSTRRPGSRTAPPRRRRGARARRGRARRGRRVDRAHRRDSCSRPRSANGAPSWPRCSATTLRATRSCARRRRSTRRSARRSRPRASRGASRRDLPRLRAREPPRREVLRGVRGAAERAPARAAAASCDPPRSSATSAARRRRAPRPLRVPPAASRRAQGRHDRLRRPGRLDRAARAPRRRVGAPLHGVATTPPCAAPSRRTAAR